MSGATIAESYGLTEGGPVPITNTRWGLGSAGSCGLAFPGCDVRLVDEAGRRGGRGYRGRADHPQPGAGPGLLEAAGGDREEVRDGWLATGDLDAAGRRRLLLLRRAPRQHDHLSGENGTPRKWRTSCSSIRDLERRLRGAGAPRRQGEVPIAFVVAREAGARPRRTTCAASSWSAAPRRRIPGRWCSWTRCRSAGPARSTGPALEGAGAGDRGVTTAGGGGAVARSLAVHADIGPARWCGPRRAWSRCGCRSARSFSRHDGADWLHGGVVSALADTRGTTR